MYSVSPYEEWFITDYDCYIDGIYDILSEYESLERIKLSRRQN